MKYATDNVFIYCSFSAKLFMFLWPFNIAFKAQIETMDKETTWRTCQLLSQLVACWNPQVKYGI